MSLERVLIVGGGFGGLAAAKRLREAPLDIRLIDRHNFHTFQPLLYQVATAGLDTADVAYPIRTILRRRSNIRFIHGLVSNIDFGRRSVILEDGAALQYDHLIIATGATASFLGIPGVRQHALPLYTLDDARWVRNKVLAALERADNDPNGAGGAAVFVVVGGGPTGVETAGALSELIDITMRHDRLRLDPLRTRVVLIEGRDRLLPSFSAHAGTYAEKALSSRGVDIRLNAQVASVSPTDVTLVDGQVISASVVIWVAGITVDGTLASTLPEQLHGPGGRIQVESDLTVPGHPEVFIVGDAAAIRPSENNVHSGNATRSHGAATLYPQVAQVAIQSGDHAALQILNRINGQRTEEFVYRERGVMATVGRRAAVAQLKHGLVISGTLGWLAWLALHLVYLIGFRNRIAVLINWVWRYFKWPSGPRLIVGDIGYKPGAPEVQCHDCPHLKPDHQ